MPSETRGLKPGSGDVVLLVGTTKGAFLLSSDAKEVFRSLHQMAPGVYDRVMTETGDLRIHINVFVGTENIRWAGGLETPVPENGEVIILPAVSGG